MNYLVAGLVPVADEQGEIAVRLCIWHRDLRPLVDIQSTEATGSPLHSSGEKVSEASNLVFGLKLVCIVRTRRYGTVGPQNSILPRVLPLFDPIPIYHSPNIKTSTTRNTFLQQKTEVTLPSYEYRLVDLVDNINDHVVIGDAVDTRPRVLPVDENPL